LKKEKRKLSGAFKAFLWGNIVHLILWFVFTNFDESFDFECGEISCWVLMLGDLPISIFYVGTSESITLLSALVGSPWWGILFMLFYGFIRRLMKFDKNQTNR